MNMNSFDEYVEENHITDDELPAAFAAWATLKTGRDGEYGRGMEDGPEEAEGTYEYAGKAYRLVERESEIWEVYDGDRYLGDVIASVGINGPNGPQYLAKCSGEEIDLEVPPSDDWRAVLEWLIDRAAPPVGG